MAKPIFQDVLPPDGKKTIRDIPIPVHREREGLRVMPRRTETESSQTGRRFKFPKLPGIPRLAVYGGGLVLLITFVVLGFYLLTPSATVSVTPKTRDVSIDGVFGAKKDAKSGELQFEVMTISKDVTKTVPATGEKNVEARASGSITIYNDYSAEPQRLIKNTRFETPEGLIYRIDKSVTVPGKKTIAGKATPGSIDATVYADAAGEDYNIGLTEFTIPGFKGDPRYSKFSAHSKTAMVGGKVGIIKVASPTDIATAESELDQTLRSAILKEAGSEVPAGYILYDSAVFVETETTSPAESSEVTKHGTLYGIIFEKKKLSAYLAGRLIPSYDGGDITAGNLESLTMSPQNFSAKPWQNGSVTFTLKGKSLFTWIFDQDHLRTDLAGQLKAQVPSVLKAYPAIERAEIVIRPFWRSLLPADPGSITVKVGSPEGNGQ